MIELNLKWLKLCKERDLARDKKFPYLIAKDSPLKELLIRHYHEVTLHGGGILTLNTMREQFWLVNGRKTETFASTNNTE